MSIKNKSEAQNPLILRSQRLMEAFAKSDDERDFYLDRMEGFLVYMDLNKPENELLDLEKELKENQQRYCIIPKLTFYETKKIMEGFVNEKVYDIDTKEKLLDIIQSKEARENFLDFIYDHHIELEKWQLFYQERSRIRIIEWLRFNHFHFVFEEDLEMLKNIIDKLKKSLFQQKVGKDIEVARKTLFAKAKTYYSNEALNPRPKRGRPPKQIAKMEIEPQISTDIYTTVPLQVRPFLFIPDYTGSSSILFSSKFETEEEHLASRKANQINPADLNAESLNLKLAALKNLSTRWVEKEELKPTKNAPVKSSFGFDDEDEDDDEEDFNEISSSSKKRKRTKSKKSVAPSPKKESLPLSKAPISSSSSVKAKSVVKKKSAAKSDKSPTKLAKKVKTVNKSSIKTLKKSPDKQPTQISTKRIPLRTIIKVPKGPVEKKSLSQSDKAKSKK